ncbi:MAG: spore germination protein [Clostridia bacterium]
MYRRVRKPRNLKNQEVFEKNRINDATLKAEERVDKVLTDSVEENLKKFKAFLSDSTDVVFREFKVGKKSIPCALVYVDGLVEKSVIHDQLMKSLMLELPLVEAQIGEITKEDAFDQIKGLALTVADVKDKDSLDEAILLILSGEVALIIDGCSKVLIISARGWPMRAISEPGTESVIRGPREGFTETLRMNTALLRRKCKDPNMVIKTIKLGRRSKTDVAYVYVKGIVSRELVAEVEKRLSEIDVDGILETGQIEQWIQDDWLTPFPQIQITERPDKTIANIFEGRVAIMVDNSPFAIIVPTTFYQYFQSPEDYYERWMIASFLRTLRWIASFIATFSPALYIAVISYHPGFIPTELALSIASSRANVPFPVFIEALLMEITIELVRESGARLPKPIGQAIGIVGGIVIGDAAVRAGVTSPILVIIVALTAVASFAIPTYSAAISFRLVRFPMMILASILGLYGVMLGFIALNIHLVNLKSFGANYMAPQSPAIYQDWKDFLLRFPFHLLKRRPVETFPVDIDRMDQDDLKGAKA